MGYAGKGQSTSSTTSAPPPAVAGDYYDLLSRAQQVASTPYQAYTGQQVANFTPAQQEAFNTVDVAQASAQPYIQSATGYATLGASPIQSSAIANYLNPYQQQVINATQGNLNYQDATQQAQLTGTGLGSGGLFNDRTGVAQANLAYNQDLANNQTYANLNSQNYSQALSAAQADRAAQAQAAYTFGNLGQENLSTLLQGAQAQLGTGAQQQQQAQANLNVPYQQWLQQQAYPYQQTGWLAGLETGVGSNLGGTSNTTAQAAPPNPYSTGIGLGLIGASLFNRGGAVNGYDDGGGVGGPMGMLGAVPYSGSMSYIPAAPQITHGSGPPKGGSAGGSGGASQTPDMMKQVGDLAKVIGNRRKNGSDTGGLGSPFSGLFGGGDSGGSGTLGSSAIDDSFSEGLARGGEVKGYDLGGAADIDVPDDVPSRIPVSDIPYGDNGMPGDFGALPRLAFSGASDDGTQSDLGTSPIDWDRYKRRTIGIESGGRNVTTGSNYGLGQFGPHEEAHFGISPRDRGNPTVQGNALQREAQENTERLTRALGRAPDERELYLAHQQGPAGAPALLGGNPNEPAWKAIRPFYNSDYMAKLAIHGNIPSDSQLRRIPIDDVTKGEFADMWRAKYDRIHEPNIDLGSVGGTHALGFSPSDDGSGGPRRGGMGLGSRLHGLFGGDDGGNDDGHPGGGGGLFGMSPRAKDALLTAGLSLLGSRSPYLGVAAGQAGLAGLGEYREAGRHEEQQKLTADKMDQQIRKLDQALEESRRKHDEFSQTAAERERHNRAQEEQGRFQAIPGQGLDSEGKSVPGSYVFNSRTGQMEFKAGAVQMQRQQAEKLPTGYRKTDNGMEYIPGGPADPETIKRNVEAKQAAGGDGWDDATIRRTAEMYNVQGPSVLTNIGRGAQSGVILGKIRAEAARQDADAGISAAERSKAQAEYGGQKAAERTLSTAEAKMGTAAFEAKGAIDLARGAIEKVPRTGFLPLNRLIQGFQNQTLSPEQAELYTRTQGIINTYAAVMARGANVTTDASRHRAEELLNTASDPAVYNRVLDTMLSEINMAINSPDQMRQEYAKKYGRGSVQPAATPQPGPVPGTAPGPAGPQPTPAPPAAAVPARPRTVPPGSAYSPSRRQWKSPDGKLFDAAGNELGA